MLSEYDRKQYEIFRKEAMSHKKEIVDFVSSQTSGPMIAIFAMILAIWDIHEFNTRAEEKEAIQEAWCKLFPIIGKGKPIESCGWEYD